jgi:hypothetical protein
MCTFTNQFVNVEYPLRNIWKQTGLTLIQLLEFHARLLKNSLWLTSIWYHHCMRRCRELRTLTGRVLGPDSVTGASPGSCQRPVRFSIPPDESSLPNDRPTNTTAIALTLLRLWLTSIWYHHRMRRCQKLRTLTGRVLGPDSVTGASPGSCQRPGRLSISPDDSSLPNDRPTNITAIALTLLRLRLISIWYHQCMRRCQELRTLTGRVLGPNCSFHILHRNFKPSDCYSFFCLHTSLLFFFI